MTSSTRGKWSAVGSIVSAPVRGYYYPGRVKAIKRSVDGNATPLYSVVFSDPLGSIAEQETNDDHGLTLDFPTDQLIGRGFEPITHALLCENQKVYITHRGREVSARVAKHEEEDDMLRLVLDSDSQELSIKLHEVRLLPSRKSGRLQEHPDYSLLANGRRSPTDQEESNNGERAVSGKVKQAGTGRRRTTSSSSASLLASESFPLIPSTAKDHPVHQVSAHIDVPSQPR